MLGGGLKARGRGENVETGIQPFMARRVDSRAAVAILWRLPSRLGEPRATTALAV